MTSVTVNPRSVKYQDVGGWGDANPITGMVGESAKSITADTRTAPEVGISEDRVKVISGKDRVKVGKTHAKLYTNESQVGKFLWRARVSPNTLNSD